MGKETEFNTILVYKLEETYGAKKLVFQGKEKMAGFLDGINDLGIFEEFGLFLDDTLSQKAISAFDVEGEEKKKLLALMEKEFQD